MSEHLDPNQPYVRTGDGPEAAGGPAASVSGWSRGSVKAVLTRIFMIVLFLLIFFVGLCVLLYPSLSDYVNQKNQSRVIDVYEEALVPLSAMDYAAYRQAAQAYNETLAGSGAKVHDVYTEAAEDEDRSDAYWSLLDVAGTGVMGTIIIPKINVRLPIYHGTDEGVLAEGAGHIQGSSLPVGGASTHAVLSAHTGLPSAKLFTDVDQLVVGDTFQLHVLDEVLTYQVDQILTVLPDEIDALSIVDGGDYVTLVTCTPYGINSHRLLIRGTRIETPAEEETEAPDQAQTSEEAGLEPSWFQSAKEAVFITFANGFEALATWFVRVVESGMDLFGVE